MGETIKIDLAKFEAENEKLRFEILEVRSKHDQSLEEGKLKIQYYEGIIQQISNESSEKIDQSNTKNNDLILKINELEQRIQSLDEENKAKENEIIKMAEKLNSI